jgi:hypothetical protein
LSIIPLPLKTFILTIYVIEGFYGSQIYISGTDAKHIKILEKELKIELLQNKINEIRKTGLSIDIELTNKTLLTILRHKYKDGYTEKDVVGKKML